MKGSRDSASIHKLYINKTHFIYIRSTIKKYASISLHNIKLCALQLHDFVIVAWTICFVAIYRNRSELIHLKCICCICAKDTLNMSTVTYNMHFVYSDTLLRLDFCIRFKSLMNLGIFVKNKHTKKCINEI